MNVKIEYTNKFRKGGATKFTLMNQRTEETYNHWIPNSLFVDDERGIIEVPRWYWKKELSADLG